PGPAPAPAAAGSEAPSPAMTADNPAAAAPGPTPPPAAPLPSSLSNPVTSPSAGSGPSSSGADAAAARSRLASGDSVSARAMLDRALKNANTPAAEKRTLREQIQSINNELIFSPKVAKGDPLVETYAVQRGDSLVKIAQKQGL